MAENIPEDDFPEFSLLELYNADFLGLNGDMPSGRSLIDLSFGPSISHLNALADTYSEITVLDFNQSLMNNLESSKRGDPNAPDWSQALKHMAELGGNSDQLEATEQKLKKATKRVVEYDLQKDNPTDPVVLQESDSLLSISFLELVSEDQEAYSRNLKKISRLIKPGGHLILIGALHGTYFQLGKNNFQVLKCDSNSVKSALTKAGFTMDICKVTERKSISDLADYKEIICVVAQKK
ncbi:nicotinamide N-methyltransferase-like [Pelodytes ibericus]